MKYIEVDFKDIGNQDCLRLDFGYRYFFDIKKCNVFEKLHTEQLKRNLKVLSSPKMQKGELEERKFLLDIGNVERRMNDVVNCEEVLEIGSDKNIVQNGDLLIPKIQPQMGNMLLNNEHQEFLASTELVEYSISNVNPTILYYLITHKKFLKCLSYLESGKTHRRVQSNDILQIKIPQLALSIQNEAVAKIEPIEQQIKELKSKIIPQKQIINEIFAREFGFDISKTQRKQFYADFTDFANDELKFGVSLYNKIQFRNYLKSLEESANIEFLGNLVQIKGGKRLPKGQNVIDTNTGYKYVRVDDLDKNGNFDLENVMFITEENHLKIKKYIGKENDVLITIVGATIGKSGLLPKELDGHNITENFARLIVNKEKLLPQYLDLFFKTKLAEFQIDEFTGKGSQGKLALFRIAKIKLPNLPLPCQQKIVDEIKAKIDKQNEINKQIETLRGKIDEIINEVVKSVN